jgi:hypothetical protein
VYGPGGIGIQQRGRGCIEHDVGALQRTAASGMRHQQIFVGVVVDQQHRQIFRTRMRDGVQRDHRLIEPLIRAAARHDRERRWVW